MSNTLFEVAGIDTFDDLDEDFLIEGMKPGKRYFDAMSLDDVPSNTTNAHGAEVFVLHIAFSNQKDLLRAIKALSNGSRKSLAKTSKEATFNGVAPSNDKSAGTWIDLWEMKMLDKKPKKQKEVDEAQAPEGF